MNSRNAVCLSDEGFDLPRLPRDAGGPVFAEPWHAQAFALAVTLAEQGHFTKTEWATTLGAELAAAAARGEPDDGSRYYEHWMAALERLTAQKGLADAAALRTRKADWLEAYRHTPHGRPVELPSTMAARWPWLGAGCLVTAVAYWLLQLGSPGGSSGPAHETLANLEGMASVGTTSLAASAGLGVVLGMRHALEPDHLAAVSALMTGERSSGRAALLGACWGLGHTATLVATGLLLALFHAEMPAFAARTFEVAVVLTLLGFGLRAVHVGASGRTMTPTHRHDVAPTFRTAATRRSLARPLSVGALHGLAGSGALMALVATSLTSTAAQLSYLLLFGGGSILGMAALSGLLGWPLARLGMHHVVTRSFSLVAGSVSVALGLSLGAATLSELF